MIRIPYVIDNVDHRLADVLNHLLLEQAGREMDIATAYFSIRGYEQIRQALSGVRHFRLLLGDQPADGVDVGLRPHSAAYLRGELNAEPLSLATQRLVEELVRFLRRESVDVRLYLGHDPGQAGQRRFLHAKCYLLYGGIGDQGTLITHLNPLIGIVGSSNFTGPGLSTNRELNLVHKTLLAPDEVADAVARAEVTHHSRQKVSPIITPENQHLLKSEVGARAILDLVDWFDAQWGQAEDFKEVSHAAGGATAHENAAAARSGTPERRPTWVTVPRTNAPRPTRGRSRPAPAPGAWAGSRRRS
jgi:phosphatidylserine/phosphatidylglycerophosphate/cardiolipin synthase-like enzyme